MIAVRDIMTRNVRTFEPHMPLQIAIATMVERNFGCVVVLDKGRLIGIITERDILRKVVYPQLPFVQLRVQDVMTTRNIVTAHPDDTIIEAAKVMKVQRIKYLPVVMDDNRFMGLVTQTDIVHNLEHLLVVF